MVVIIGGGITGLAAAFELSLQQIPFVLLEAAPRLGGLIHTHHIDGFTIEAGPDSVLVQKPAALELFEQIGLGPEVIAGRQPRTAYVLKRGELYPLPSPSILGIPTDLGGLARYRLLPPAARARVAMEPLVRPRRAGADESVASFFRRRFGRATVSHIAEPLLGGIHAGDIDALSVQSLFPRLVDAERVRGSVIRAFRHTQRDTAGEGLFRSLAGGMGRIVSAIEQRLPDGSIRTNTAAGGIGPHAGGWRVSTPSAAVDGRAVIVAAPAFAASRILSSVDARVATLCAEVPYVSTVSIALGWKREAIRHPLNGSGFVVARRHNAMRISACTWVSSKWDGRAPADAALLRVYIGGAHDPAAVDLDDRALVEIATRDVGSILGIDRPPFMTRVYRWRNAGAQHNVGQLARMAELEQRLSAHRGLFVAGSGFRSVGIPDCIADGRGAALRAAEMVKGKG